MSPFSCFSYRGAGDCTTGFNTEVLAISSMSDITSEHKVCFWASLIHKMGLWAAKK